ncbi:MAG: DUF5060 domain-containing protein [Verrucomicrobia bacterium]|nr:DUF5060 domain-containing protein [Verrucomicrobiota bacterium]
MNKSPRVSAILSVARVPALLALAVLPVLPAFSANVTVPRWGRFEAVITNAVGYRDPFRDVKLQVRYTRPDGRVIEFPGFYDGGAQWRLRFMPDEVGEWSYTAAFTDGSHGATGRFICAPSDLPGLVVPHVPNPIWFGFADGSPFLMRSLHVGDRFFARNWDDPDNPDDGNRRAAFLDWAQAQGYNTLSIASHYLNRQSDGRGHGWDTPRLWPLDPAEFRHLERMLDDLAARRIVVFPFAGFFGRDADFPRAPEDQRLYLEYTVARLGPYWNMLFNVAGPEPLLRNSPYLTYAELNQMAEWVRELDVFGRPLTIHNETGDDVFRGEPWFGFGTLQGPKTRNRRWLAEVLLRNHHPARPLYAQETLWPGNTFGHPAYSDDDIRRNAFVMLFSATMINFGDMNGSSSSGFAQSLDPADAVTNRHAIIRHVWDTFAGLPWPQTKPRPDLVNAGFCLADPGRVYLVYLEEAAPVKVHTRAGEYQADWFDARAGARSVHHEPRANPAELKPPGAGDWILMLTARSGRTIRERDGVVEFEAEAGVGDWTLIPSPTGRAIQSPGEGRMRYEIEFTQPGKFYVFLLARQGPIGRDKENDVLLSLNGEKLYGQDDRTRPDGMRSYGGWRWTHLPKGPGNHTPDAIRDGPVYFVVHEPGVQVLEIAHRSANYAIDRVLMKLNDPTPPPAVRITAR